MTSRRPGHILPNNPLLIAKHFGQQSEAVQSPGDRTEVLGEPSVLSTRAPLICVLAVLHTFIRVTTLMSSQPSITMKLRVPLMRLSSNPRGAVASAGATYVGRVASRSLDRVLSRFSPHTASHTAYRMCCGLTIIRRRFTSLPAAFGTVGALSQRVNLPYHILFSNLDAMGMASGPRIV